MDILNNPWFIVPCTIAFIVLAIILLFVYMPRTQEIRRLQAIIDHQHETITRQAVDGANAANAHKREKEELIADIGEMSSQVIAAQGRENQAASRADQIARAASQRAQ